MNKITLTAIIVIVIGAILFGFFAFWQHLNAPAQTSNQTSSEQIYQNNSTVGVSSQNATSTSASAVGSLTVAGYGGAAISVKNFIQNPQTVKDPNNAGYYYLSGGVIPTSNTPYQIFYVASDQSFHVTLYQEPIAQYRQQAEQALMQELGISETDMCRLTYWIGVGPGVNALYNNVNLGWSFCPGATQLQ